MNPLVKDLIKLTFAAVVTAIITVALATLLGGASRSLAERVDENAARASRNILEKTYISTCALFSPPYPEREFKDIEHCFDEAADMPESVDTELEVGEWLELNLEKQK